MSTIEDMIAEIENCYFVGDGGFDGGVETSLDIMRKHCKNMVLVPAEPTEEMIQAGVLRNNESCGYTIGTLSMAQLYKAMLSASQGEGK